MSMKKKLKIAGVLFGIVILVIVFLLCYKAGNHMAEIQREEEQEQLELTVTPIPTEEPEESVTPVSDIFSQQEETIQQNNKKYKFLEFAENLGDLFTEKQIKKIKKAAKKYLNNSRTHAEVDTVTCTEFHYQSQTRNQIYGYLKLDDGSMLQYTYDFDSNEVKVMETAVTSQNLEDKKKQEEAAQQALKEQEETNKKREEQAQEIFNRGEAASSQTGSQTGNTASYSYPSISSTGQNVQNSQAVQNDYIPEEETTQETIEMEENEESTDADAVFEEEIPEDIFTDR